jgi:hypothetical protein
MGHGHNQEHIPLSCVILHNLMIENESNCNLRPLFYVGSNVSHLNQGLFFEDYCQGQPKLKMWLPIIISKMTCGTFVGSKG